MLPPRTGQERNDPAALHGVPFAVTAAAIPLIWGSWLGWSDVAVFVFMYLISGLGVTVGFHRMLTHRAFLKEVWGPNAVEQPEHLWTLVAQLRRKIEPDPSTPRYLLSEPWVGYRFVTE